MIVPDVNLLIHAYNRESRVHVNARAHGGRDWLNGKRSPWVRPTWAMTVARVRPSDHPPADPRQSARGVGRVHPRTLMAGSALRRLPPSRESAR